MTPPRSRRATFPTVLPTAVGGAAVLGGATALTPLVTGTSWWITTAEVLLALWLAGVGARALSAPSWVTVIVQTIVYAAALTALTTTAGIAGVIPGPAAVDQGRDMLSTAWDQVMTTEAPMPTTPAVTLLIALCLGGVGLAVDILIGVARTPGLTALPLLALYAVPASIADTLLPWYAFVLPAAGYAAILATSRVRPARRHLPTITGLTTAGVVITVVAIGGAVIATGFASGVGTNGRIPHAGRSSGAVHINPWAHLRGELSNPEPTDALRVSGLAQPHYLRTFALNTWVPGEGFRLGDMTPNVTNVNGTLPDSAAGAGTVTAAVTPLGYHDRYLPMYLDTVAVTGLSSGWSLDTVQHTVFRDDPVTPDPYTVTTMAGRIPAKQLRTDTTHATPLLTDTTSVPAQVGELARTITAEDYTTFDATVDILDYFTDPANGFTYSLQTPPADSGSALVDFLTDKSGYCEQYAVTMAMLLRTLGIPARVGIGFTQGERQPDGSFDITSANAHAWVEVRFDRAGWVTFDPTPRVGGQGGLQGFVDEPSTGGDAEHDTEPAESTATSATTATTTAPAESQAVPPPHGPGAGPGVAAPAGTAPASWLPRHRWLMLAAIVVALAILAMLTVPAFVRRRRRRQRMAQAGSSAPGTLGAVWDEIVDTFIDHGIAVHTTDSARATARRASDEASLDSRDTQRLDRLVTAAENEWYAAAPVLPPNDDTMSLAAVIRAIEHSRPQRWRDRLWPRSLRQRRASMR